MFRPEETDLGLLWRSDRTVESTQSHHLVVVIDPLLAVECIWTLVREELRRA